MSRDEIKEAEEQVRIIYFKALFLANTATISTQGLCWHLARSFLKVIRGIIADKMDIKGGYAKPHWTDVLWVQLVILPLTVYR